jgi:MYXO-CTERM domain-containing protein
MRLAVTVAAVFFLGSASLAQSLREGFNDAYEPSGLPWQVAEVGWFYTPTTSFTFNEIRTYFSNVPAGSGLVHFELREPVLNINNNFVAGPLLRETYFLPEAQLAGGTFDDFQMIAGQSYFMGFRDVEGLGLNVTDDDNRGKLGLMNFSTSSTGQYATQDFPGITQSPILQMWGGPSQVPETGTLTLLALGGLVAPGLLRRRR